MIHFHFCWNRGSILVQAISKSTDGSNVNLLINDFLNYRIYDGGVLGAMLQDPDNGLAFLVGIFMDLFLPCLTRLQYLMKLAQQ